MRKRARRTRESDETDTRTLEMMLDYAIIEGAELRLPMFVLLLRTARLELMTSIKGNGGLRDRRVGAKITDYLGTDGSFAAPMPQPHRNGPAT